MTAADKQTIRSIYFGAAIAIAAIMFAGFARNYYLRAWIGTRVITFMVHVHGFVMTAWVVMFVTQTLLIAKHRIDLHRKLGMDACVSSCVIVDGWRHRRVHPAFTGVMQS